MLLADPIDADTWVNRPFEAIREQAAALEHGLGRFFAACAAHQQACGFGAGDPEDAFDDLAGGLDAAPMAAPRAADPRPVDGDDLRFAAMYADAEPAMLWPRLAGALAEAQGGDASALRDLTDQLAYERTPAGDSPTMDVNWVTSGQRPALSASDRALPRRRAPQREPLRAHLPAERLRRGRDGPASGQARGRRSAGRFAARPERPRRSSSGSRTTRGRRSRGPAASSPISATRGC